MAYRVLYFKFYPLKGLLGKYNWKHLLNQSSHETQEKQIIGYNVEEWIRKFSFKLKTASSNSTI